MARRPRVNSPSPPEWWGLHLYDYLRDLKLAGWVWEFMRRDRLKTLRPGQPADVMNPDLGDEEDSWDLESFYRPWPDWPQAPPLLTVPTAVRWKGVTRPAWCRYTWHNVDDVELEDPSLARYPRSANQWVNIRINVKRSDAVILRDLGIALKEARKTYPKPRRVNPRVEAWIDNKILQVWDLRQFGISATQIVDLPGMVDNSDWKKNWDNPKQSVDNAYNTAKRLIDEKGWQTLALQVDDVFPDARLRQ